MNRRDRLMPGGIPRYVRCYDFGEHHFDRFTVVFTRKPGGLYLAMSEHPFHPQGLCQHGEGIEDRSSYSHLGKRVKFESLPDACKLAVVSDYKELWGLQASEMTKRQQQRVKKILALLDKAIQDQDKLENTKHVRTAAGDRLRNAVSLLEDIE